jgi:adenosylcobinamide-GDP ribazoletransferase
MQMLAAAFKYMTIWGHFSATRPIPAMVGGAAIYFPLVGLVLGLLLALLNYCLAVYLASELLSIVLIAVLVIANGGIQLECTKRTFDALALGSSPTHEFQTWGFISIIFVILCKTGAIEVMDERLTVSLLLTPVAARWALVIFLFGGQDHCDVAARTIAANVKFWHVLLTTAATLALAAYLLGRKGLWLGLALSVFSLLSRSLLKRRDVGITQDNFGAVIELSEVLSLILLASL